MQILRETVSFILFKENKIKGGPGQVAQLVGASSREHKIVGSIPCQGTYLGYKFNIQSGHVWEATH